MGGCLGADYSVGGYVKQYYGEFDANKQWFTNGEWNSLIIGIVFTVGMFLLIRYI